MLNPSNPTERKIRRELTSLAELCVRGGSPFKDLRTQAPFNTYPRKIGNAHRRETKIGAAPPELRTTLENYLIAVSKWHIGGEEFADRNAADELHKFYSNAIKGFVPRPITLDSRISAKEAQRTIEHTVPGSLPDFQVCKLPFSLPKLGGRGRRIVSFGKGIRDGKILLLVLDPNEYDFSIYFGLSDPFFSINMGNFWGLGQATWYYQSESQLKGGLALAVGAVNALVPFVQEAVERGLE